MIMVKSGMIPVVEIEDGVVKMTISEEWEMEVIP